MLCTVLNSYLQYTINHHNGLLKEQVLLSTLTDEDTESQGILLSCPIVQSQLAGELVYKHNAIKPSIPHSQYQAISELSYWWLCSTFRGSIQNMSLLLKEQSTSQQLQHHRKLVKNEEFVLHSPNLPIRIICFFTRFQRISMHIKFEKH